jgi:hypothetical protein
MLEARIGHESTRAAGTAARCPLLVRLLRQDHCIGQLLARLSQRAQHMQI